jgi:hypothetical protein
MLIVIQRLRDERTLILAGREKSSQPFQTLSLAKRYRSEVEREKTLRFGGYDGDDQSLC